MIILRTNRKDQAVVIARDPAEEQAQAIINLQALSYEDIKWLISHLETEIKIRDLQG
jgi:hypothetical protein